ncbi:MAG: flagellar motor switch protein FliN [Calditrichaeota bacterium]|nr:flagellar motor switch protein FliN [Calditrichota bacterium]
MKSNQLKDNYQAQIDELRPILTKSLSDLFQRPVMITEQIEETTDVSRSLSSVAFPKIALMFQSGDGPHQVYHLILFPDDFVLSAYAWMINEDPVSQIDENHLDSLKEIFNQILGQVRMSIPDDKARFHIENLQAGLVEKPQDALDSQKQFHGAQAKIKLESEGQTFFLEHIVWNDLWNIEEEGDNGTSDTIPAEAMTHVNVEPAEFGSLGGNGEAYEGNRNIEMLLDVDLEITVELDRKSMLVSELLKLGKGSIVEFQKSAGEPLDILVNGRKFAEGEVVVIDDKFGIRITQLISARDRLKTLT